MDTQIIYVLLAGVFALSGTYLGSWLNRQTAMQITKLEQRRYTAERLWDARKTAYGEILAKLRMTREHADRVNQGFDDNQLGPHGYFGTDAFHKDTAATHRSWKACYSMFSNSEGLLSEEFVTKFREVVSCKAGIDPYMDPPEIAWQEVECFSEAYSELMSLAREELEPSDGKK